MIADTSGRIREVNLSSGIITTVAGNGGNGYVGDNGPAAGANLVDPASVVVDASGDLFIADTNNDRIREVNVATGIITTVAGSNLAGYSGDSGQATKAALSHPTGVAVDASGNLFIADEYNNRVREVNLATGIITTVAGNGTAGYSGDGSQATGAELTIRWAWRSTRRGTCSLPTRPTTVSAR